MNEKIHLFVVEMDYRPKNPNKPQYKCWAKNAQEARLTMADKFPWLNLYSVRYATKDEYEKFCTDAENIRIYTHNYIRYWHILKENGFL